jgi:hypothetical protein
MFPKNVPPPISPPAVTVPVQQVDDVKRLNTWFMVFWICLAVSIPLSFMAAGIPLSIMAAGISLSIIVIGLGGIIAAVVFQCFILHRLWSLVPRAKAQTTPGRAVGFLFIPFFNFYWNLVAFHGLAEALNAETKRASITDKEVNEGLTLTYCILLCCTMIPYLKILASFAAMVIWIISLKQLKDAGVALIEKQRA